jgi:uncharacterized protein (DUF983 family)
VQNSTPVSAATRIARGLTLRCPECGSGGILASWFRLRAACPRCGLLLDRGTRDFFIGAYLINLIVSEVLFAAILFVFVLRTWPDPPWDLIQYLAVAAIVIAPITTYPFTKSTWLAVNLVFEPPTDKDRRAV